MIVQDDQAEVHATFSRRLSEPLGVVEAKVKAFEVGVQFAKDIGIQDFILEGDSIIIHRAV